MVAWRVATFEDEHLSGVVRLCEAEGWPSLPSDPTRAQAMLAAPNTVTVVALIGTAVVGFAFDFSEAFYETLTNRPFRGYRL